MTRSLAVLIVVGVVIGVLGCVAPSGTDATSGQTAQAEVPTGSSECQSRNGLPDSMCTPGAADPRVTQANIHQTICVSGYSSSVRPPVSYTDPLKVKLIERYGLTGRVRDYELDHLIPLELGGDPRSEQNLWPEPWDTPPDARQKDTVENYLHKQVCEDGMKLADAQHAIATDWVSVYKAVEAAR